MPVFCGSKHGGLSGRRGAARRQKEQCVRRVLVRQQLAEWPVRHSDDDGLSAIAGKPAPTGSVAVCKNLRSTTTIVGASLLAMGPCQATSKVNVRPPSRAGSLLQGICVRRRSGAHRRSNCRSEPARDEAIPGDIDIGCPTAIAGKPAPTGDLCRARNGRHRQYLWERACPR
jgi:hypothetical protein